jgi:predicted ATP-dependent endonuclease of OLD family
MKIEKIILENFRAFYETQTIPINDFTAFIGKNDQGKSSVLEALDIFINEDKGEPGDLNVIAKNSGVDEFRIGVVFTDFPKEVIIDATNPTNIEDEYLVNKDGKLEVWKTFKNGKLKQTSIKCNHPVNNEDVKNLLRTKNTDLKKIVESKDLSCDDKRKSASLRKVIRDSYGTKLIFAEIELVVDAEDAKKIWEQLVNYLPVYALFHSDRKNQDSDSEVQDPLKITIEQIFKREDILNKLNGISQEIEKEIKSIADSTISKFKDISKQDTQVKPNIPEVASLKWKEVYKNIGFNTENDVPLNKRGSGIRRLMLLSFFLAEVEREKNENKIHTVYAIEEPETSLHPDLQKELLESLLKLSENYNYQILMTTHSPQFTRLLPVESIRYVEGGRVETFDDSTFNKIIKNLGLLPNIGKAIWCVEGKNDEMFLRNINKKIPELKSIIDIESCIDSGLLAFNLMNGADCGDYIDRYVTKNTNAVEFHLYDKDKNSQYQQQIEKVKSRKDGSEARLTQKRETENYVTKDLIEERFKILLNNVENWDELDIPRTVATIAHIEDKKIKKILNCEVSQKITKSHLESLSAWDEVKGWFETVRELVDKASTNTGSEEG